MQEGYTYYNWNTRGKCRRIMAYETTNVRPRSQSDKNVECMECGEWFHAYIIPGRSEYKCNGCKF